MFHKMPFILIGAITSIILLDPIIPFILKQFLYSISLTTKEIIILLLPFIIFTLLFKTTITLSNGATKIISIILILVCISNFISTFLSHYVGIWAYSFDLTILEPKKTNELVPLWSFELPKLIANDKAMFLGIILGVLSSRLYRNRSIIIAEVMGNIVDKLLKCFVYFIPMFVVGFVIKIHYEGVMGVIIKDYTPILFLICVAQFSYIIFVYFILNNLEMHSALNNLKNMLPAALSGFSTMSSALSMPLTIIGAENNATNKDIARSVVPATVNIHLVGDCFAIPILAYSVLKSFGMQEPTLLHYLIFTCYFVLAKFSVAAIPGGGIIVMLPLLETYLGFNAAMMSLITTLYILFDPIITCANVLGNGAFAKMIDKLSVLYPQKDK